MVKVPTFVVPISKTMDQARGRLIQWAADMSGRYLAFYQYRQSANLYKQKAERR